MFHSHDGSISTIKLFYSYDSNTKLKFVGVSEKKILLEKKSSRDN